MDKSRSADIDGDKRIENSIVEEEEIIPLLPSTPTGLLSQSIRSRSSTYFNSTNTISFPHTFTEAKYVVVSNDID